MSGSQYRFHYFHTTPSLGHSISCLTHHLEQAANKLFTGWIGVAHVANTWAVTHRSWVARCSPFTPEGV